MTLTSTYSRLRTFETLAPRCWIVECTWKLDVQTESRLSCEASPSLAGKRLCQKWSMHVNAVYSAQNDSDSADQWCQTVCPSVLSYAFLSLLQATFFAICWKAEQLWSTKWASSRRMRIEITEITWMTSLERCNHAGMGLQLAQLLATG